MDFKCLQCGICCGDITNEIHGLYISDKEKDLFPAQYVRPLFRNGDHIFAYQVIAGRCPHSYRNHGKAWCAIYEKRPILCKSFPMSDIGLVETNICILTRLFPDDAWDMYSMKSEFLAKIKELKEAKEMPEATEMFMYKLNKWVKNDGSFAVQKVETCE